MGYHGGSDILKKVGPKFDTIRLSCRRLKTKYDSLLDQIPDDLKEELTEVCFEITAEDIVKLAKDYLNDPDNK